MLIRLNRRIAGQFHGGYWDLEDGDTVQVDDAKGARYCATGLAEPVRPHRSLLGSKDDGVQAHWTAEVPGGNVICRRCSIYIERGQPWAIRDDEVPGGHLWRRPEHAGCA
jgi:hypothetical protein